MLVSQAKGMLIPDDLLPVAEFVTSFDENITQLSAGYQGSGNPDDIEAYFDFYQQGPGKETIDALKKFGFGIYDCDLAAKPNDKVHVVLMFKVTPILEKIENPKLHPDLASSLSRFFDHVGC